MRHFIIVGLLVILVTLGTYFGLDAVGLLPVDASAQASPIDFLWDLQLIVLSFLFALIVVPLVYSLIVFRRKPGDTEDAVHVEGNTKLEVTWTVIPLITVVAFAYLGAWSLRETRRADPQAMVVRVIAQQFAWSFEYPEYGGFITDQLYLPIGRQVLLQMTSRDVIHSFWVPEFRVKQDVLPGRETQLRITPTRMGRYKVRCAELCGAAHYSMENAVIVVDQVAFEKWAQEQRMAFETAQTPEQKGERLVRANGCLGCHTLTGQVLVGPSWKGLFGSERKFADGTTTIADEAYIIESILNPAAKIVAGFQTANPMPAYVFDEEQLSYIIAYLKTLK